MVVYRRHRLPGGTLFSTLTLAARRARALTEHIGVLRESWPSVVGVLARRRLWWPSPSE